MHACHKSVCHTFMCMCTHAAAEALIEAVKTVTGDTHARFTVFRAGQNDCCFDRTVALRGWEGLMYGHFAAAMRELRA